MEKQYGTEKVKTGTFSILNNTTFLSEHDELIPLYEHQKQVRQQLTKACTDSLPFEIPSQAEFIARFSQAPLAVTYYELSLLDHELLKNSEMAMEHLAQKMGTGPIFFPIHPCRAMSDRLNTLNQLVAHRKKYPQGK